MGPLGSYWAVLAFDIRGLDLQPERTVISVHAWMIALPLVGDTQGDDWSASLNPPADLTFDLRTSNGSIAIEGVAL